MNFPIFKSRASASGHLMTDSKEKSNKEKLKEANELLEKLNERYNSFKNKNCTSAIDILKNKIPDTQNLIVYLSENLDNEIILSETAKNYVKDWAKEHIYGIKKELKNKYLSKGLVLEDTAIDKTIEWLDLPFAMKNEKYFEDEFFCGTPDLIVNGIVYDTKCSWDCFSFPLFEKEIPTKDYFYQLQVYMHLTGCKKAVLTYVLLNTPDSLVYETKHNYDNLNKEFRVKTFDIDYNENIINELKNRILTVRKYIQTL